MTDRWTEECYDLLHVGSDKVVPLEKKHVSVNELITNEW